MQIEEVYEGYDRALGDITYGDLHGRNLRASCGNHSKPRCAAQSYFSVSHVYLQRVRQLDSLRTGVDANLCHSSPLENSFGVQSWLGTNPLAFSIEADHSP